jgi:hypothetical protein
VAGGNFPAEYGERFGDDLDMDEEDEALAAALAPGMRMSRALSIAPDADASLALHMLESHGDGAGAAAASSRARQGEAGSSGRQTAATSSGNLRVFAISDLHTDFSENMQWIQGLPPSAHRDDVLIVAGDVSDHLCAGVSILDAVRFA